MSQDEFLPSGEYIIKVHRMGKQIQNYSLQLELGSGNYSRVYKAINVITKQEVAIKMVKADKFKEMPKLEEGTINQINTLSSLRPCANIIRYLDMLKTVNNFYFVYEYCNGGTLEKVLKKAAALGEKQSLIYFRQLTNAFRVLAENNIMHRDIKPENILIHNGVLKVADFGFCKPLEHEDGMAETMLGSPIYMAPEVLKGEPYTMKADVWSLGVVLYRMIFGFCPFESSTIGKLIQILDENELKIPDQVKISPLLEELLRRMLTKNSKYRADWAEVFSYDISPSGDVVESKSKVTRVFDSTVSSKASTSNSFQSCKVRSELGDGARIIKRVQSPGHHNQSTTTLRNQFHVQPPFVKNIPTAESSLRETVRSSSPYGPRNTPYSRKQAHLKNHKKCLELSSMAMDVSNHQCPESSPVAYFLCRTIQKQFLTLKQLIKKDLATADSPDDIKSSERYFWQEFDQTISEELLGLSQIVKMLESQLEQQSIDAQDAMSNKKFYLKRFVELLKGTGNKEELALCQQLLDFIVEDILINKKTYEKLRQQQMCRKIIQKLQQIY